MYEWEREKWERSDFEKKDLPFLRKAHLSTENRVNKLFPRINNGLGRERKQRIQLNTTKHKLMIKFNSFHKENLRMRYYFPSLRKVSHTLHSLHRTNILLYPLESSTGYFSSPCHFLYKFHYLEIILLFSTRYRWPVMDRLPLTFGLDCGVQPISGAVRWIRSATPSIDPPCAAQRAAAPQTQRKSLKIVTCRTLNSIKQKFIPYRNPPNIPPQNNMFATVNFSAENCPSSKTKI